MASAVDGENIEQELRRCKYLRRGKKAAITKRIQEIERLVNENGKKRMIEFLIDCLNKVFDELSQVCLNIASISSDDDEYNDVEDVRIRVETCAALVANHLGARSNRSSSTGSMTSSWVRKHAVGGPADSLDGVTDIHEFVPDPNSNTPRPPGITDENAVISGLESATGTMVESKMRTSTISDDGELINSDLESQINSGSDDHNVTIINVSSDNEINNDLSN